MVEVVSPLDSIQMASTSEAWMFEMSHGSKHIDLAPMVLAVVKAWGKRYVQVRVVLVGWC